jgi:hypothetical protein
MYYATCEVKVVKPAVYRIISHIGWEPPGVRWGWERLQQVAAAAQISPVELLLNYAELDGEDLYILEPDDSPDRFRFFEVQLPWKRVGLEGRDRDGVRHVDRLAELDALVPAGWALAVLKAVENIRRQTSGTEESLEARAGTRFFSVTKEESR